MPVHRTRDISPRSLEVTTDALQPPTLAIISPTPRAFTFPIIAPPNAANSSPYSSPSSSPFEPDLQRLTLTPSPPTFLRTLSPVSSSTSVSSTQTSPVSTSPVHKRRKSSCSDLERRPKKGDEDYIKRPENAFILFRRKCCEERQAAQEEAAAVDGPTKKQRQADLSKTISQQWKSLSPEERHRWEELAKEKKKEHEQLYPNYVYRPQRSKDKDGRSKNKKRGRRGEDETDSDTISFVLPWPAPATRHGRSASAPTPPLGYQTIQLPSVYMPSCPTSPSLMPMISRRTSSRPGNDEPVQFDYLPGNNLISSAFGNTGEFEANLQSDEFFQGMFDMPPAPTNFVNRSTTASLQQLIIPQDPLHLSPHQLISPSSSIDSASPVSPNGPFTPADVLAAAFSNAPSQVCMPEPGQPDLQYPSFEWDTNSLWPSNSEMLLGDDFDLSSIPPMELGLSKADDAHSLSDSAQADFAVEQIEGAFSPTDGTQSPFDGLFGFDNILGQGF